MKKIVLLALLGTLLSCVSTKNGIMNIDDTAILPKIIDNRFVLTEYASDLKYGYSEFYPINVGFSKYENSNNNNVERFFNAITGLNGEKVTYKLIETCCPFPTKNNKMGAGTLDLYEVTFTGNNQTYKIYIDTYEKGKIICPKGFLIKNSEKN